MRDIRNLPDAVTDEDAFFAPIHTEVQAAGLPGGATAPPPPSPAPPPPPARRAVVRSARMSVREKGKQTSEPATSPAFF